MRAARIEEAVDLSTLALQSKGYWGYDEAFMAECRSVLTLTEEYVGKNPTYLYERNGKPIAFYSMVLDKGELDYFYVHPDYIGSGIGQKMWQHVLETARTYALSALIIQSDPHAHPFYTKMGAVTIGQIDSEVDTSRKLPLLQVTIQ
ncbi:acetyltransferase [Pontibacillus halophilus JSM 076056 = DSM 19796]|uniref:Acetyltransferase n=1 Tax=Pontibacillus halophilus JSM 076056 = DSM 19796 TaxID=1385510 RepID=A0A0A5I5N2_9BACI|nr:acetyltransferase [Pontibacillus halophilus JSM 076056 = DSM 19796]